MDKALYVTNGHKIGPKRPGGHGEMVQMNLKPSPLRANLEGPVRGAGSVLGGEHEWIEQP